MKPVTNLVFHSMKRSIEETRKTKNMKLFSQLRLPNSNPSNKNLNKKSDKSSLNKNNNSLKLKAEKLVLNKKKNKLRPPRRRKKKNKLLFNQYRK